MSGPASSFLVYPAFGLPGPTPACLALRRLYNAPLSLCPAWERTALASHCFDFVLLWLRAVSALCCFSFARWTVIESMGVGHRQLTTLRRSITQPRWVARKTRAVPGRIAAKVRAFHLPTGHKAQDAVPTARLAHKRATRVLHLSMRGAARSCAARLAAVTRDGSSELRLRPGW